MPSTTYYHLPDSKREKISEAMKQEFVRVPVDKVSINRIIREAGISRGSFYQYFVDKNDMIQFMLTLHRKQLMDKLHQLLGDGTDIFEILTALFDDMIAFSTDKENAAMCRNIYPNLRMGELAMLDGCTNPRDEVMEIAKHVDVSAMGVQTEKERFATIDVLLAVFKSSVVELFQAGEQEEDVRARFQDKINIIKRLART